MNHLSMLKQVEVDAHQAYVAARAKITPLETEGRWSEALVARREARSAYNYWGDARMLYEAESAMRTKLTAEQDKQRELLSQWLQGAIQRSA